MILFAKPGFAALAWMLLAGCWSVLAAADTSTENGILERLQRLEENQARLEAQLRERDQRIQELESALGVDQPQQGTSMEGARVTPAASEPAEVTASATGDEFAAQENGYFGEFQEGGLGIKLADTPKGELNFSAWAYLRYLNQQALDDTYTDSFGRTRELDLRNDLQVNKVNLYFKGWVFDPRFHYLFYVWTANTSQGDGAQVVVAGNMSYTFNEHFTLAGGIGALPGTRSLRGNFPYWNKVDTRPIGDEFFRPSYTTGIWASGNITEDIGYKVMIGNNLSQLGVNASQLDSSFNTFSGSIWWMPTTGEFGPAAGYGDFEEHTELATLFGLSATYSPEDRQSQPGTEDIQNTQIRLSDGNILFEPRAFDTDGRVNKATYQMMSFDAAMKYRGFALEGEYYVRLVNDFKTEGDVPVDRLFDHGFQIQPSIMLIPKTLQGYVAGSYLFGEYGEPWDIALGINWYPFKRRLVRWNTELLYLRDSPVGYSSVPFIVGGNGTVFHTNFELFF